jgi:hypothetical protein
VTREDVSNGACAGCSQHTNWRVTSAVKCFHVVRRLKAPTRRSDAFRGIVLQKSFAEGVKNSEGRRPAFV